jgi:hypothetical protein
MGSRRPHAEADCDIHSKSGKARYIPLNLVARAAFQALWERPLRAERVFQRASGQAVRGYKHWFDPAVEKAGLKDFT